MKLVDHEHRPQASGNEGLPRCKVLEDKWISLLLAAGLRAEYSPGGEWVCARWQARALCWWTFLIRTRVQEKDFNGELKGSGVGIGNESEMGCKVGQSKVVWVLGWKNEGALDHLLILAETDHQLEDSGLVWPGTSKH